MQVWVGVSLTQLLTPALSAYLKPGSRVTAETPLFLLQADSTLLKSFQQKLLELAG